MTLFIRLREERKAAGYNTVMQRKVFWALFSVLGLIADFELSIWWCLAATVPIAYVSWWVAYRSDWF